MSLKEELSNNRRAALAKEARLKTQADEEMRKIIHNYVYPILRHINSIKPLEKTLSLQCDPNYTFIDFSTTMCDIPDNLQHCKCQSTMYRLFNSATIVGPEMDLKVTNVNDGRYVIFEITLDD